MSDNLTHPMNRSERAITWLADAPLFIDEKQVSAFYDAVVRPEFANGPVKLSRGVGDSAKQTAGGEAGGEVGLGFLAAMLPGIKVNAKAKYDKSLERTQHSEETVELSPIDSPHRQLIHLALHYESNLPDRWKFVENLQEETWRSRDFIAAAPRALVFLDLAAETPIIPTVLEGDSGSVKFIFPELKREGNPPEYPEWTPGVNKGELWQKRRDYWNSFRFNYSDIRAMRAIESCVNGDSIRWIDFRVPVNDIGDTLHLHIQARNGYDTGTFAYNLVLRGFAYGLCLVGTLKSEPDLNVLAVFEK